MEHTIKIYYIRHENIQPDKLINQKPLSDHLSDQRPAPDHPSDQRLAPDDRPFCELLPDYCRRAQSCHTLNGKCKNLASALLLSKVLDITEDGQLMYGPCGKPYLADGSSFFSLSHDENLSILTTADFIHGADLEKITALRMGAARIAFPDSYKKELEASPDAATFTRLWTQTEAILKAEGCGFTASLKDHPDFLEKWQTRSLVFEDFCISAAAEIPFVLTDLQEICYSSRASRDCNNSRAHV